MKKKLLFILIFLQNSVQYLTSDISLAIHVQTGAKAHCLWPDEKPILGCQFEGLCQYLYQIFLVFNWKKVLLVIQHLKITTYAQKIKLTPRQLF